MWSGGSSGPPEHRIYSVTPAQHEGRRKAQMRQCTFLCGVDRGCGCSCKAFCPWASSKAEKNDAGVA